MTIKKEIGIDRKGRPYVELRDMTPGVGLASDTFMNQTKYFDSVEDAQDFYNAEKVYTVAQVRATVSQYKIK